MDEKRTFILSRVKGKQEDDDGGSQQQKEGNKGKCEQMQCSGDDEGVDDQQLTAIAEDDNSKGENVRWYEISAVSNNE